MRMIKNSALIVVLTLCNLPQAGNLQAAQAEKQADPWLIKPLTIEVGPILSSGALYQQEETATSHRELNTGLKLLLGALVPGLPQFLDGKVRAWGYFAAEATSIAGLIAGTVSGNNFK